ncbi:MAG TPA: prepilin-type N-terminal cleavage/methylation domain-containing protein [Acidimicrobiales bacterium]|nr:prepilin-type N-terminal cleavage/methylation domain-containing protein [Acidimicrobiales bacterium]
MTRTDDGFTLIELLIAVTLSTMLVAALGMGVFTYIRTADATANRLGETPQFQVAATRFAADVQRASSVQLTDPAACSVPAGSTLVVGFSASEAGSDLASVADDVFVGVSYSYRTVATSTQKQFVLERSECRGSSTPVATMSFVNSGNPAFVPTATCGPTGCGALATVSLPLHICTANADGTCRDGDVTATLTGARRF